MVTQEMVAQELREEWHAAVEEIVRRAEETEPNGNSEGPGSTQDDALMIVRTKVYAGKCNSLLSYVKG